LLSSKIPLISSQLSRASAVFLLVAGLAMLFASDVILPQFVSGFPAGGAWLGQLLGASWLAVGTLNWLSRAMLLGGIYGRPIVLANLSIYFIGAMVLLRTVATDMTPTAVWFVFVPLALFSVIYGWLLLRGPLLRDFELNRGT
jgi:hypothetical protein